MAGKRKTKKNGEEPVATGQSASARHAAAVPGVSAVVGIGASAGGLEALEELFRNMPADTGMAFVVVTHLHPGHRSLLPELPSKITDLTVVAAATGRLAGRSDCR